MHAVPCFNEGVVQSSRLHILRYLRAAFHVTFIYLNSCSCRWGVSWSYRSNPQRILQHLRVPTHGSEPFLLKSRLEHMLQITQQLCVGTS